MKTQINTIGSVCGKFVEYQWFVTNEKGLIACGFAKTIEQAKQLAASASK